MRYEADAPKIPAAALAAPDASLLKRLLARGPVKVKFTLGCRTLPDGESANVIGEIPGREKPGEIVLLGAHLDSWDLGTGALDDTAGCGIVIEAARQIFTRYLPLIVFEQQPGVAIRKEILRRRGVLASNRVRLPGVTIDAATNEQLGRLLDATFGGADLTQPVSVMP